MIQLSGMERNGNIGGNNSNFEDIMREGGVSDEFTPHRWTHRRVAASVQGLGVK